MAEREEIEGVDRKSRELVVLERKTGQLRRLAQNVGRDRARHEQMTAALTKMKIMVQRKELEAQQKEEELWRRAAGLASSKHPVDEQEAKVGRKEIELQNVESEMADIASDVEHEVKIVHQEQKLLAELLLRIPDEAQDQFCELRELLEQNQ
jgi:uncharacterized protein YegL